MRLGMHTFLTQKFCFMCIVQFLNLNGNRIGDTGMISFADALGKGALASLEIIQLAGNPGDAAPVDKVLREREK